MMNCFKGCLFLALSLSVFPQRAEAQPNIIFVMADDLGYGDLSCYGQTAFRTPYLDLMAAEGMRFTDAYSGSTVCAPSRSTLMTGLHAGHTSVRSNTGGVPLEEGDVTVAEVLKAQGYATGGFGKWGLGDLETSGAPEKQGFDRFVGYYHQVHAHSYYPDYLIDTGTRLPLPENSAVRAQHPEGGAIGSGANGEEGRFAQEVIKEAMFEWIRENAAGRFFCYAPWTLPHGRFEIPASSPAWQQVKDRSWSAEAKGHAAFVLMLDQAMGELFQLLRDLKIDDNTVVFFCSDNGPDQRYEGELDSAGRFRGAKRSLYEGGLRVPLIVRWPGVVGRASVCALPVYFPDMMPTLAELAGVESGLPADMDGASFAPVLHHRDDLQIVHDVLYWEWTPVRWAEDARLDLTNTVQAVRMGNWKAVRQNPAAAVEVYDLTGDPGETRDVADEHPMIRDEAQRVMTALHTDMRPQAEPERPAGQAYR